MKDRRRKHQHWQATVTYNDGEKFERIYIDRARARRFAARQRACPVVKCVHVREVNAA